MSTPPHWRRTYDALDKAVTPRAEAFVRSSEFATGAVLLQRAQKVVRRGARSLSARAWHLLNLPAGSDVSTLRAQIGGLDREVRRLALQVESERRRAEADAVPRTEETTRAHGAQSAEHPRPRAAGRRAQRAAGT